MMRWEVLNQTNGNVSALIYDNNDDCTVDIEAPTSYELLSELILLQGSLSEVVKHVQQKAWNDQTAK